MKDDSNKKIKQMGLGELSKRLAIPKEQKVTLPVANADRIRELGDLMSENPQQEYERYLAFKQTYDRHFENSSMEDEIRSSKVSPNSKLVDGRLVKAIKPKEQTEEDKAKIAAYAKSLYAPKPKKAKAPKRLPSIDTFKKAFAAALMEQFNKPIVWHNYIVNACKVVTEWCFSIEKGEVMYRGLLLLGACGTGKTNITKALKATCDYFVTHKNYNWEFTFSIGSMKDIAQEAKAGLNVVEKYRMGVWCFDDVGFEPTAKSYGNEVDAFEDILDRIYRIENRPIIVSTNLIPERGENGLIIGGSIEERYGTRVADRANELFLTAYLGQKSYRGK